MKSNRHQKLPLQLEALERREMLTAEFLGRFDYSPGVWEVDGVEIPEFDRSNTEEKE